MNDENSGRPVADNFARRFAPPELYDEKKRREWKLGRHDYERGPYVIELNLQHIEGLPGAKAALDGLLNELKGDERQNDECRRPPCVAVFGEQDRKFARVHVRRVRIRDEGAQPQKGQKEGGQQ